MEWKKLSIMFGFLISMTSFASAQFFLDLERGVYDVTEYLTDVTRPFFQWIIGDYSGGDIFLIKCLLLILLFVVINLILRKTTLGENNRGAAAIIAIITSILAVRFMPDNEIFTAILLPYNTL